MSTTENVEKPSRSDEDALVLDTPVPAEEEPPTAKEKPPVESVKDAAERVQELRVMRALKRYGTARGNLLAGGIAYSGLFSVAAALTIAWTIFMSLMGSNLALRRNVLNGIDAALPGIIQFSPGDGGIIKPDDLVLNTAINLTSVIACQHQRNCLHALLTPPDGCRCHRPVASAGQFATNVSYHANGPW